MVYSLTEGQEKHMKLYDFQNTGKDFLKSRRYALLADDMGLGKTAQAITAINDHNFREILIIVPASVKYQWQKEFRKWNYRGFIEVVENGQSIIKTANVTIVNYDLIHRKKIFTQLIYRHWDLIICDEAHYLKNNSAKRTKVVYFPKGLKDRADRVWLLTGTPVLNRPVELFSHLKALVPERLGPYTSFFAFTEHFCDAYETKWGWDYSGASNIPELSKILDGFMLRRLKEDVLDELPEVTYQTINFAPDKKMKKLNIKERREYAKEKEGILGELASMRHESGVAKVPFVVKHIMDVLEDKQKAVVFAYQRDVISQIMESCRAYSPVALTGNTPARKRQEAVETFKSSTECRLFIGQIEAAGVGIDGLQNVCDTVIFAEMSWTPGQIHQAVGRCHRIGQNNPVLVQFLIVEGSIDEDIAATVASKEEVIKQLVKPTKEVYGQSQLLEHDLPRLIAQNMAMEKWLNQQEEVMSIEQTLERIADALEVMAKIVVDNQPAEEATTAVPPAPAPKKRAKRSTVAPVAPAPEQNAGLALGETSEGEVEMSAQELVKYCNAGLKTIADANARVTKTKEVVALFKKQFGVVTISALPTESVMAAKAVFDDALAAGEGLI